jgi:hypothetical protein
MMKVRNYLGQSFLWGHIIFAAVILGGSFYEMMVINLVWSASLPESLSLMSNPQYSVKPFRFWGLMGGLPALFLLGALIFNWQSRRRRYLILISFLCILINALTTNLYFLPALRKMFSPDGGGLSGAELTALGNNWILGTWGRMTLLLVSLVVSVWAMSVPLPKVQAAERAESEAEGAI